MTRGRAATPDPFDLGAVAGSDELFEALSTRRLADLNTGLNTGPNTGLNTGRTDPADPAAALLAALVADVDAGAPPLPAPGRVSCGGMQGTRRRGVRVVVTFGVAALVLTSAGAAAAGGGDVSAMGTGHGPARHRGTERSNENVQRQAPAPMPSLTDRRAPEHHAGDRRHGGPGDDDPARGQDDQTWSHRGHRSSRGSSRPPVDIHHQSPRPDPSWGRRTPTPLPEYLRFAP